MKETKNYKLKAKNYELKTGKEAKSYKLKTKKIEISAPHPLTFNFYLLSFFTFYLLSFSLKAQTPTQTENYVKSTEYLTESGESGDKKVNIMYLDGLGREKQAVSYKATPDGKDMIVMYEYDEFGRQVKDFLPVPTRQSSGLIITDPESVYNSYYDTYFATDVYYSEKELEESVLGRPLKQAAPGDEWALGSGKEIKFDYSFNSASEVKVYKVVAGWSNTEKIYESIPLTQNGYYPAKDLYKTVTTDENGNYTMEFRNKFGQTVLKRAFVTAGSTAKLPDPEENQQLRADTYYVYDQYGNLTYVLPPLAAEKSSITQTILDELCYQYKYDKRNRLAARKLPGKGWEYLVYDRQDRLVATQDAEMAKTTFVSPSGMTGKAWAFTKYDAFGRAVYTGLYKSPDTRKQLQDLVDGYGQNNEARSSSTFTQNSVSVYYTKANAFPKNHSASNADLLTVNYYDTNYTNLLPAGVSAPSSIEGQTTRNGTDTDKNQSLKGLPIASFARVIPGDGWEKAYTFYDQKSRPVGTYKYNHLGGYTKVLSKLDFRGKPEYTKTLHKRTGTDTELEVKDIFTYDGQERLTKHTHKTGSGTEQLLALNIYNRIGQLDNKKTGGTNLTGTGRLQQVDYRYNIRGWLTDINNVNVPYTGRPGGPGEPLDNDDLFSFHIDYNEIGHDGDDAGFPGLYNGNISQTLWKTSSDNTLRGYVYGYDELNRLREAVYHKPGASPAPFPSNYDEKMGYDINGNIKELKRFSGYDAPTTGEMTDELTYTYAANSNKLVKVDDSTNSDAGFKDGTNTGNDYTYDSNANMVSDKNKGITSIKYNHLNLPVEIYWSSTKKINYLYNAAGQKVQKKVTNGTTVHTTDYLDGFQYYNNNLEFFPTAEGYVKQTTLQGQMTFDYVFNYTDHLGNIRVSYTKDPHTGDIKILEENHYYPFGLKHQKYADFSGKIDAIDDETAKAVIPDDPNQNITPYRNYDYKYNGKEWQDELGLNMYDMDMRMYDPAIARWVVMDPVVHHSMSPYNAFDDNPVFWADPSGAEGENTSSDSGGGDSGLGTYGIPMSTVLSTSAGGAAYTQNNGKGDPPTGGKGKKDGDSTEKKDGGIAAAKNKNKEVKLQNKSLPRRSSSKGQAQPSVKAANKSNPSNGAKITTTKTIRTEHTPKINLPATLKVYSATDVVVAGNAGPLNLDVSFSNSGDFLSINLEESNGSSTAALGTDGLSAKYMGENNTGIGISNSLFSTTLSSYQDLGNNTVNSMNYEIGPIGKVLIGGVVFIMATNPEVDAVVAAALVP